MKTALPKLHSPIFLPVSILFVACKKKEQAFQPYTQTTVVISTIHPKTNNGVTIPGANLNALVSYIKLFLATQTRGIAVLCPIRSVNTTLPLRYQDIIKISQ